MMLYLTGASSSSKFNEAIQDDPMKSLGGYISSNAVPNMSVNTLFDLVSLKTIKEKTKETIAIGLVNKFNVSVFDISFKIISDQDNICEFKVAATSVDKNNCMEHIYNRYSEPFNVRFHDATFFKGSVDVEIINPAIKGEEIIFEPFDIEVMVEESGIDGTFNAINKAFQDSDFEIKRITTNIFRIKRKDDIIIEIPFTCSYLSTENAQFKFFDKFKNIKDNEVVLIDELQPNEAIGIWIQRNVTNVVEKSNEDLLKDYDEKRKIDTLEEVELVINYNIKN